MLPTCGCVAWAYSFEQKADSQLNKRLAGTRVFLAWKPWITACAESRRVCGPLTYRAQARAPLPCKQTDWGKRSARVHKRPLNPLGPARCALADTGQPRHGALDIRATTVQQHAGAQELL